MSTLLQDITFHDDSFTPDLPPVTESRAARPLPLPGFYRIRILEGGVRRNQDGSLWRGRDKAGNEGKGNPMFNINRIAILEPEESAGEFSVYQAVWCSGQPRRDPKTNAVIEGAAPVYQFIELLRAIDANEVVAEPGSAGFTQNLQALERLLDTMPTLQVKLTWYGEDKVERDRAKASGHPKPYSVGNLSVTAYKNADGTYRPTALGPSGEMVPARLKLKEFYPDSAPLELGPYKRRTRD